jgi:dTDP-4-amino-4,6-dideoxygalactose transaminase
MGGLNLAVPFLDLKRNYQTIKSEVEEKLVAVAQSQRYIVGPEVEAFEKEVAEYLGVKYAIGVASGTDALILSLKAAGVGPGDEVITSDLSFFSSAGAISWVGARPVFADIEPDGFNIDPLKIEEKITKKTRAILPVHLFGEPAELTAIKKLAAKHKLPVIEDACQAIGSEYQGRKIGGIGDAACYSFYPTKVLGGFGDGGLIATNSKKIFEGVQDLRVHGAKGTDDRKTIGTNSRLDELQAAVLRIKLKHLEGWIFSRRNCADIYEDLLSGLPIKLPGAKKYLRHTFNAFVVRAEKRDDLLGFLRKKEIGAAIYYSRPFHLFSCFKKFVKAGEKFPRSLQATKSALALPLFPELTFPEIEAVTEAVREFYSG